MYRMGEMHKRPKSDRMPLRLLFVGDSWHGSNARSLREAFARRPDLQVAEVNLDHVFPSWRTLTLRIASRLLAPLQRAEFERAILRACREFGPDCIVFYKGSLVRADFIDVLKRDYAPVALCFPDCSPHAHGSQLKEAIGRYDLVVSMKNYHPANWLSVYGYRNRCVFVPHGYDPGLHLSTAAPASFEYDVVLAGLGRPEYYQLILGLAEHLKHDGLKVAISGDFWRTIADQLPSGWIVLDAKFGTNYVDFMRTGRIVLAPVQRHISVNGVEQPGDEDSARTYEIAAAHCFFIHRRTEFVRTVYDEAAEVPMYEDAVELAAKIRFYMARPKTRQSMALAAHRRAVPSYSMDARAAQIVGYLQEVSRDSIPAGSRHSS